MLPPDARRSVSRFVLICLGGALGTGARYLVGLGMLRWLGPAFPFGTLTVNVIGSFLLGVIMALGLEAGAISPDLRVVLATGVMGGFTTYSSFNYETVGYFERGAWVLGWMYLLCTLVACFLAGVLGIGAVRWLVAR